MTGNSFGNVKEESPFLSPADGIPDHFQASQNALGAAAHPWIRVSAPVRHENLKRLVFFYSFVFFQNKTKTAH
jgi:hypothetical protein